MAWKFFSISKANAEITRLEGELAKITKERDDLTAATASNDSETATAAEQLQTQLQTAQTDNARITGELTAAQGQVTKLTTDLAAKDAELVKVNGELATAKAQIANPSAAAEKIAAVKAAQITGAQGQPPAPTTPANNPAAPAKANTELKGFAKIRAAIKAQITPPAAN